MKFKKVLIGGIVSSATVFSLVSPSFAATANGATSTGHIQLITGAPTTSVDPIYPNTPDGSTGNIGPLTIDNVSPLEFGSYEVSGQNITATATTTNPNAQVTDARGTGAGWTLQVSSSPFTDGSKTLNGAILNLPTGTAQTVPGNVSAAPQMNAVSLDTSAGTAINLITAQANQGMGTWVDLMDNSQIKLTVPSGNLAGDYTATLTWTLVDAPQ